jgi:hypothetical protein
MAEVAKGIIDIEINTGSAASQLQALQAQINAFNLALNKSNKAQGTFAAEYSRELQGAINKTGLFTAETVRLSTAAATLDKTLSKGKTSLGQFFSAKFNKDSAIAAETMALAAERAKRLQTQFIATSGAANGMQEALAVRPLAAFSSELSVAAQRTQILSNMFKQGTTQLINFGKNVQWAGRQLMVGFTVPLTIFGAVAGKTFMELEKQMVGFKKVYGDIMTTPADLDKNLEAVKGLASEYTKYGIAVKDTIGLAAQAAAAGRQNADLTDAVSQATRLATLGQMEQNAALETTISLQSAFKLSGQDLADTINFLNMVENQTVVSLQDIAAAIPRVAPVISGLGGDVKDLTVFLAAMQEGGVDAAEGANALKSGLASLINPTKQATEMLNGMGINLETIIQANKGDLMGTVQSFAQALAGLDQFSRQQALEQVFGKFQYAKLGALFDNISRKGSQAQQVIATMGYTTEQLGATADKELKTIEESFGVQLTGAVERFKLAIAPIGEIFVKLAIPLVNFATKIAESFNGLSDGQKRFAAIATVIVGVVIPAVTMLTGLFLNLVGTLAKMTQGMALFSKGFLTGGPIGAFKALSQSSKYLSLAEMDAAMAAQQLSGASQVLNTTLIQQVGTANAAAAAIANLTKAYGSMIATQGAAGALPSFGVAAAAGANAKKGTNVRVRGIRRNNGGGVPGVGNTDTVPAMLTPGEFVVNKEATKENLGLLKAINDGKTQGLNKGGVANGVQYLNRGAIVSQARSILEIVTRGKGKMGTLDDAIKGADPKIAKILQRYGSISMSGGFAASKTQASPTIKRSLEKTHFGNKEQVLSLEELSMILGTKGGSKRSIAEALIKGGIPVQSLSDDWILLPKSINQAARSNTTTPMNISSVIKELKQNVSSIKFKDRNKDSAFSILNPNETPSGFAEKMSKELSEYIKQNGDALITDDIFTLIRNRAYPNMIGAGKSTGIRLPSKTDIGKLAGVDVNSPLFAKSVNDYFAKNNIPLSADQIVAKKPGSNNWWALQLLDSIGGSATNVKNKFASSTGFNSGGPVPGTGNSDTVPAMLTPGEFVVNKKATSQNQQLLEMMNGGKVKGYNKGGMIASALGNVGQMAGMATGSMPMMVAGMIAQMGLAPLIGKMSKKKEGADLADPAVSKGIKNLGPVFKNIATVGGRLSIGMASMAGGVALAGLAIYKLNESAKKAEKSGAELAEAMYGSATTTKAMADAFGRETNATALRRKAVEKAGGQEITQESVAASGEFMKSDAAAQMIKDLELVKKSGQDVSLALRNQLTSSIIAGAVSPEEAKAIAIDMGKALNDEKLAVQVAGELSSLIGPNGEKLDKNIVEITAEISPKIDGQKIKNDAEKAYEALNLGEKFGQLFSGGKENFIKDFSIDEISERNAAALAKEAESRAFLNLAYQEGTITLKEYLDQEAKITSGAEERSSFVENANAQTMGFASKEALDASLQSYLKYSAAVKAGDKIGAGEFDAEAMAQGEKAYEAVVTKGKENLKQAFLNSGMEEDAAASMTDEIANGLAKIDPGIFDKFLSGQIPQEGYDILMRLESAGDLTPEDIDRIGKELTAINAIPNVDKILNFNIGDEVDLTELYNDLVALEESPDIWKGVNIQDGYSETLSQFGIDYSWLMSLPNTEKVVLLRNITTYEEVNKLADIEKSSGYVEGGTRQAQQQAARALSQSKETIQQQQTFDPSPPSGGGSGGKKKDLVKDWFKEARQQLKDITKYTKLIDGAANATNIEALKMIPQEVYLKMTNKQRQDAIVLMQKQIEQQNRLNAIMVLAETQKAANDISNYAKALGTLGLSITSDIAGMVDQKAFLSMTAKERLEYVAALEKQKNAQDELNAATEVADAQKAAADLRIYTAVLDSLGMAITSDIAGMIDQEKFLNMTAAQRREYIKSLKEQDAAQQRLNATTELADSKQATADLKTYVAIINTLGMAITSDIAGMIDQQKFLNMTDAERREYIATLREQDAAQQRLNATTELADAKKATADLQKYAKALKSVGISIDSDIAGMIDQEKFINMTAQQRREYIATLRQQEAIQQKLNATLAVADARKAAKNLQGYANVLKSLGTVVDSDIAGMIDQNAILHMSGKERVAYIQALKDQLNVQRAIDWLTKSSSERTLESLDLASAAINMQNSTLNTKLEGMQRENELVQRQISIRNRALDLLSKEEEKVNTLYDDRITALDKVAKANDRIAQQDRSRVDLSSALASGNIAAAANAASTMQQQEAQYRIEDSRTALESQRQKELESLTVSVNGVLMTRKQIQEQISQFGEQIYKNEQDMQAVQDTLYANSLKQATLDDQRMKLEQKILLTKMKQNIEALRAQGLTGQALKDFQDYIDAYNSAEKAAADIGVGTPGQASNTTLGAGGGGGAADNVAAPVVVPPVAPVAPVAPETNPGGKPKPPEIPKPTPDRGGPSAEDQALADANKRKVEEQIAAAKRAAAEAEAKKKADEAAAAKKAADDAAAAAAAKKAADMAAATYTKAEFKAGILDSNLSFGSGKEQHYIAKQMGYKDPEAKTVKADAMEEVYIKLSAEERLRITNLVKAARKNSGYAFNVGGLVPGITGADTLSARVTPGEFIIRKAMTQKYGLPLLQAINNGAFDMPKINQPKFGEAESTRYKIPEAGRAQGSETMYNNTYNVNVNVSGTNASPDDIANVVMAKLSQQNRGNLRSSRY